MQSTLLTNLLLDRLKAARTQEAGAEVLDECDFELAFAHLRVPEMA